MQWNLFILTHIKADTSINQTLTQGTDVFLVHFSQGIIYEAESQWTFYKAVIFLARSDCFLSNKSGHKQKHKKNLRKQGRLIFYTLYIFHTHRWSQLYSLEVFQFHKAHSFILRILFITFVMCLLIHLIVFCGLKTEYITGISSP